MPRGRTALLLARGISEPKGSQFAVRPGMPELDPLLLSRIQFAFTISFHILFPSFTIGLAAWLVVLEALWLRTGRAIYRDIALHWTRIFAVSFGMGVVSGVVLSYEFGTNWSELSRRGGNGCPDRKGVAGRPRDGGARKRAGSWRHRPPPRRRSCPR